MVAVWVVAALARFRESCRQRGSRDVLAKLAYHNSRGGHKDGGDARDITANSQFTKRFRLLPIDCRDADDLHLLAEAVVRLKLGHALRNGILSFRMNAEQNEAVILKCFDAVRVTMRHNRAVEVRRSEPLGKDTSHGIVRGNRNDRW